VWRRRACDIAAWCDGLNAAHACHLGGTQRSLWARLDPFDPSDNILAGTAYLKDMHDRFGSARFIAAYHASSARYEQHLATGQPLPAETTAYVAAVTPLLSGEQADWTEFRVKSVIPWREALCLSSAPMHGE